MLLPGIDVSDWQGEINWDAVAQAGYEFAIAKATEGTGFVAHSFARNWAGIKGVGMVRGAYHFARPDSNAPSAEADFFVEQVGELEAGDLLALDLEAGSGHLAGWALEWLNRVTELVGFGPLLYSSPGFLDGHGCTGNAELAEYGLWLASWRAMLPAPPSAWPFIGFWQHTDKAGIPGIQGACDGNFFNGPRDRLVLYGKLDRAARSARRSLHQPEAAPHSYVVRVGETARAIAVACGSTIEELESANPDLGSLAELQPGTVVQLPTRAVRPSAQRADSPPGETFPVRGATNLADVAATLKVSMLALHLANPQLANPDQIPPGALLNVPPALAD
jgi:GH25 family lysozyme M1 (1,4-beta-N-acetylmuramidase)/LysM repeat protein